MNQIRQAPTEKRINYAMRKERVPKNSKKRHAKALQSFGAKPFARLQHEIQDKAQYHMDLIAVRLNPWPQRSKINSLSHPSTARNAHQIRRKSKTHIAHHLPI